MKPKVDDKRCGASQSACKAINACPTGAIRYIEVDEPIVDRTVDCNCGSGAADADSCGCGCGCGCSGSDETNACGGTPYGRIVVDYDKCTGCGLCVEECCGMAITMVE